MENPALLVIEDDVALQTQLNLPSRRCKWDVAFAKDLEGAIRAMRLKEPAVVIQDLCMAQGDDNVSEGLRVMRAILRLAPNTRIVATGANNTEHALQAVSMGAYDFFPKPMKAPMLELIVNRALRLAAFERTSRSARVDEQVAAADGIEWNT